MSSRLTDLLRCEVPIQLSPMGSVSVTPALPLAECTSTAASTAGLAPAVA